MALRSAQSEPEKAEVIEENLGVVEKALDRVKVLYEQYFLGIQKQPPSQLHTDCERRLRDLSQLNIRNTALRYRFATLQQKFGSYNSYWRRTLRQIEQGKYHRNLSKVGRQAAQTGESIPEEILAAMPKRMRDQVQRDREAALAIAKRRQQLPDDSEGALVDADLLEEDDESAVIQESTELRRNLRKPQGPHVIDESDGDLDLDAFFAAVTNEAGPEIEMPAPKGFAAQAPPARPMGAQAPPSTARPDTSEIPVLAGPAGVTGAYPRISTDAALPMAKTGLIPSITPAGMVPKLVTTQIPKPPRSSMIPTIPSAPAHRFAPSQAVRPNPIAPGASAGKTIPVESMAGPFPRAATGPSRPARPTPPAARPTPPAARPTSIPVVARAPAAARPPAAAPPGVRTPTPPGMTDADVNALYAKYVKAKSMIGEEAGPGAYSKLLKTINAQAPKIMEQYKAKGVDFSVVVKDNQVIIRAKPKT